MVGNDVVDLRDPDADASTLHPRFDLRAFAESERASLADCADAGRERWAMWAAKEAAYKLARRLDHSVVFSPPRFVVSWQAVDRGRRERMGRVQHPAGPFEVLLREGDDYVHAIALLPGTDPGGVVVGIERPDLSLTYPGPEGPGRAARALAGASVGRSMGLPPEALEVRKRGRIPELWRRGAPAPGDLSLSHHGALVAFAYLPDLAGGLTVADASPVTDASPVADASDTVVASGLSPLESRPLARVPRDAAVHLERAS